MKKLEKEAKKEKQGDAIQSLSGEIERTTKSALGQEEKKKKEAGSEGEKLHPRLQNVLNAIERSPTAKKEYERLLAAGCDKTVLLEGLFASFGVARSFERASVSIFICEKSYRKRR